MKVNNCRSLLQGISEKVLKHLLASIVVFFGTTAKSATLKITPVMLFEKLALTLAAGGGTSPT